MDSCDESKEVGQGEEVTRAESAGAQQQGELGLTPGHPFLPQLSLVMQMEPPDLSYCLSFGLDSALTSPPRHVASHAVDPRGGGTRGRSVVLGDTNARPLHHSLRY